MSTEEKEMSSNKRTTMLVGFAAIAVILVAVIAFVRPSFRPDEATGAIGAVQKHHAPQITKADVVLGDENFKQSQKVSYSDYLADAQDLKNFAAVQNRADLSARLRSKASQVDARLANDYEFALGVAQKLASDETLSAGVRSNAQGIIAILIGSRSQNANRAEIASRYTDLANKLYAEARVDMKTADVADLASAQRALASMETNSLAMSLREHATYFDMMSKQSAILAAASVESASLAQMASRLEARAQENISMQMKLQSEDVAALGRMSQLADRSDVLNHAIANRYAGVRANLEAMSALAGDRAYASMLRDSDSFSTQVKALMNEVNAVGSRER